MSKKSMRALVISDNIEPILYSPAIRERVGAIDLILSCGDLPFYYVEYVVSMLDRPCYYVFGNHGQEVQYQGKGPPSYGPGGADNMHSQVIKEGPLLMAGLEGSLRYSTAPRYQYTESQMWGFIGRLVPGLVRNRIRYGRWLDVLVTHAPPFGIHDQPDRCHTGFRSFLVFMRWFKPRYLLHGHIHIYRRDMVTTTRYFETEVVNVYPYRIMELEPGGSR